jgi:hypothetical protein
MIFLQELKNPHESRVRSVHWDRTLQLPAGSNLTQPTRRSNKTYLSTTVARLVSSRGEKGDV